MEGNNWLATSLVIMLAFIAIVLPIFYVLNGRKGAKGGRISLQLQSKRKTLARSFSGAKNTGGKSNIRLPSQPMEVPSKMDKWLPHITSPARRVVAWDIIRLNDLQLKHKMPLEIVSLYGCGPFFERPAAKDPLEEAEEDIEEYHCWVVAQVESDFDKPDTPLI